MADTVRLKGYAATVQAVCPFANIMKIRIVTDTTSNTDEDGAPKKKKKKPSRGYAFIVYEREKDMKSISSLPLHLSSR